MTFDEAIEAFATAEAMPVAAMQWVLDEWDSTAARCRALLRDYVGGVDLSERTEQSLYVVIPLLSEKADAASFADLCRLAADADRWGSVFGDAGPTVIPSALISTFNGDSAALHRLIETEDADEALRAEVLLALAYLARTNRIPESEAYGYLAELPDRLVAAGPDFVWSGWARAIAVLGFAGLSGRVEQALRHGLVHPDLMDSASFWEILREAQANPQDVSAPAWETIGPIARATEFLEQLDMDADESDMVPPEPIRNPLRNVGRNDPCPCGSGKKFKKCCLAA